MQILRLVAAGAVLAAGVAAAPASAHMRLPRAAAGETIVEASTTGSVDLTLRDDARVANRETGNPDVSVQGAGRLVGFWLYRLDGSGDSVMALRYRVRGEDHTMAFVTSAAPDTNCHGYPSDTVPAEQQCGSPSATAVLHEGIYRLVVLTDGAPVTVRLRLHGLAGSRTFSRLTPRPGAVTPMTTLPNQTGDVARAKTTVSPAQRSLAVTVVTASVGPNATLMGSYGCIYDAGDPLSDQMLPGCPGGSGAGGNTLDPQHRAGDRIGAVSLSWSQGMGAGSYTVGQVLQADSGVTIDSAIAAWLATPGSPA